MNNLKALIKSADDQAGAIRDKHCLLERFEKKAESLKLSSEGYNAIYFSGERKAKFVELFESFIKEDEAALAPLSDKLNTISKLLGE